MRNPKRSMIERAREMFEECFPRPKLNAQCPMAEAQAIEIAPRQGLLNAKADRGW